MNRRVTLPSLAIHAQTLDDGGGGGGGENDDGDGDGEDGVEDVLSFDSWQCCQAVCHEATAPTFVNKYLVVFSSIHSNTPPGLPLHQCL